MGMHVPTVGSTRYGNEKAATLAPQHNITYEEEGSHARTTTQHHI